MENNDLIYKVGSFYLYDNQLNVDYLILYNRKPKTKISLVDGDISVTPIEDEYESDLPYDFSGSSSFGALYKIYNLPEDEKREKSIEIMRETCERNNLIFLEVKNALTFIKVDSTHMKNYNAYYIYYNETIGGINIMEYELAAKWNIGNSSYSNLRLHEFKERREESIHINNLNKQKVID